MKGRKKPFTTEVTLGKPDESRYPIICRGLIDTGAARTSIDEGLAQTLNLEPRRMGESEKRKWSAKKEVGLATNRSV